MPHASTISYTDGVVTIRPQRADDLDADLEAKDDAQIDWMWEPWQRASWESMTPTEQRAHALRNLEANAASFGPGPKWSFAVDTPEHRYVAYADCDLANPHVPRGEANISYSAHPAHRGRGHVPRAVRLVVRFLAEHTEARVAHIVADAENAASLRVARAVGAREVERWVNEHGRTMVRHVLAVGEPEEMAVEDPDELTSVVYRWLPLAHGEHGAGEPRAVVHILHGWAEHALRYDRVARSLIGAGYAVYADDHRGHGQSGLRNGNLGDLGPRGADGVLDAVHAVTRAAAAAHPGKPMFVLGHSWGSFLLQRYLRRWSAEIDGALLTGTTFRDASRPQTRRASPNDRFEPARTAYDWLSRDATEVDLYIADPLCGFELMRDRPATTTTGSGAEAWNAAARGSAPIRPGLPILVFNGADDPIGGDDGGRALAAHYRDQGITDVAFRSYPGARHELFNETNRREVIDDVIGWLDARA